MVIVALVLRHSIEKRVICLLWFMESGVTLRKFQIHPFLLLSLQLSEGTCFLPTEVEPVNTPDGPITPVPDGIRPVMRKHRIEVLLLYIYTSESKKVVVVDFVT